MGGIARRVVRRRRTAGEDRKAIGSRSPAAKFEGLGLGLRLARCQDHGKGAERKTDCHEAVSKHGVTPWVEKGIKRLDFRAGLGADGERPRTLRMPPSREKTDALLGGNEFRKN